MRKTRTVSRRPANAIVRRRKGAVEPIGPITPEQWASVGWARIHEPFAGAWQRNLEIGSDRIMGYGAVFACATLIASDIAKLWVNLVQQDQATEIWSTVPLNENRGSAFRPVLRRPNRYSNRITFFMHWMFSKLYHGNTYVLKARSDRNVVSALYILDPLRTKVLIGPDGAVYYQVQESRLNQINAEEAAVAIPASEIIHDVMYPIHHPLIGVSPIVAAAIAATQGIKIQETSVALFANNANPGGILTTPHSISTEQAAQVQSNWETNYVGPENVGRVAVLGDGLKYEPMTMKSTDAQLIEQLKWTSEQVCWAFHVPPYMIGIGTMPTYNNIQALNQQYYAQCLQILIEALELNLDEGLELPKPYGVEFDIDALLRMDSNTAMDVAQKGINAGLLAPNEGRRRFELPPKPGGDNLFLQQQYWPLDKLADRPIPDPSATPPQAAAPAPAEDDDDETGDDVEKAIEILMRAEMAAEVTG